MDLGIILLMVGLVALVALLTWVTRWPVKINILICGAVLTAAQRLGMPALANKLVLHLPFDASLAIYLLFFLLPTMVCASLIMARSRFTTMPDQTTLRKQIAHNHYNAGEIISAKPVHLGVRIVLLCGLGVGFCALLFQVVYTIILGPKITPLVQGFAVVMSLLFVLPTLYSVTRSALKNSSTTFFIAKDWLFCCSPSAIKETYELKDARLIPMGRGHSGLVVGKGRMFEFQLDHQQSEKLAGWIRELNA